MTNLGPVEAAVRRVEYFPYACRTALLDAFRFPKYCFGGCENPSHITKVLTITVTRDRFGIHAGLDSQPVQSILTIRQNERT